MKQKLFIRVLLGVVALLLIAGMVVQFTPTLNGLGGGPQETPAIKVNDDTITVEELERVRQSNPVLSLARDGVLGEDFKTAIVDQAVRESLLAQAAEDVTVSKAEISEQVQQVRAQNNLLTNREYQDALSRNGLTDSTFREQIRQRLAIQKAAEAIQEKAPEATEAEAKLFWELNRENFRTEPRIAARAIVVEDEARARELLAQVKQGADFAKLAGEFSLENKERGGALGPVENGKVRSVPAIALPQEVSEAAFRLTEGGVTDVVKSGDKFYVVKVEEYVPAGVKPFEEAKREALEAVRVQKRNEAVEEWLAGLQKDARVEVLDKNWEYYNPVVATVDGREVRYAEVLNSMLNNPQFGQFIQQGGDQAASIVNGFFKPQVLSSLIQGYAAEPIVQELELPLTGSRQELLAGLQAYGGREARVTDAELRQAYEQQREQFSSPASATVNEATFRDREDALAFRQSFVKAGGDFTAAASRAGGTVNERGSVTAGDGKLDPISEQAVFTAERLAPAGEGSVSDVVEIGGRYKVLYVEDLVQATARPLEAVREQLREQLLAQKRASLGQQFVEAQLKDVKVENKLAEVIKAVEERAAANAPEPLTGANPDAGEAGEAPPEALQEEPAEEVPAEQ